MPSKFILCPTASASDKVSPAMKREARRLAKEDVSIHLRSRFWRARKRSRARTLTRILEKGCALKLKGSVADANGRSGGRIRQISLVSQLHPCLAVFIIQRYRAGRRAGLLQRF